MPPPPASSSSSSSDIAAFDTYYQEFASLLEQLGGSSAAETTKSPPSSVESLHKQCSDLISLMSLEARTTECPDTKFERLERVKIYKFQLEAMKQQHDKDFLMGASAASMLQLERERQQVRSILEQNETRAAQQNELLERARQSVEETQAVGMEILNEAHRNRETIESAQGRVDELSSMTDRASKLVQKLSKPWWMPRR